VQQQVDYGAATGPIKEALHLPHAGGAGVQLWSFVP
jgi:hypothetical protein